MNCKQCGQYIDYGKTVCSNCGAKIESEKNSDQKETTKNILFGFRSNKGWKKCISLIYLVFSILIAVMLLLEDKGPQVTVYDCAIEKISGLVGCVSLFLPFLCLSDTLIREKLPFFKKRTFIDSLVGLVVATIIISLLSGLVESLHSKEYKADMENHAYVIEETIDATCTEEGKIKRVCEYCGTSETEFTEVLGHDIQDGKCVRCGEVVGVETTTKTEGTTSKKDNSIKFIEEDKLNNAFLLACKACDINVEKIKNFEKIDDWIGGKRYNFTYNGLRLTVYCNSDETISSINLGQEKIYMQGYEPYNVSDYIINSSVETQLIILTEDYVKTQLNYPNSADFATLSWAFGRDHNIYAASGKVTAQNAFGIEQEISFVARYNVENDKIKLVYLEVDGNISVNNLDEVQKPERKQIASSNKEENVSNKLVYGEKGKYGEDVIVDGEKYIHYNVPAGKYKVTNTGNKSMFYIASDKYYTNSSGYKENEILETITLTKSQEVKIIEIPKGYHIELVIHANIEIEKVE